MLQLQCSPVPGFAPFASGSRLPHACSKGKRGSQLNRNETITFASGDSGSNTNPMDFEELSEIIRMVNSTDVVELELKSKRFSLSMRKKEAIAPPEAPAQPQMQYVNTPPPQQQQFQPQQQQWDQGQQMQQQGAQQPPSAPNAGGDANASSPAAAAGSGTELLSPMGGTYYRSPAPGEPPFCREGDKVEKGQTVAIIEAMKLMNTIEAEVSGTVVKLVVENGTPVTPGQPLLIIEQD